jgi:sorting nexin-1/2
VEHRRQALQRCLSQILKHPLLYTDPDLRLFLESDTFVTDVKQRALNVASTSSSGVLGHGADSKPSFFSSLTGPRFVEFDEYFDVKRSSLDALETASKGLTKSLMECTKQRTQVGAASSELMSAYNNLATCELSTPVREKRRLGRCRLKMRNRFCWRQLRYMLDSSARYA